VVCWFAARPTEVAREKGGLVAAGAGQAAKEAGSGVVKTAAAAVGAASMGLRGLLKSKSDIPDET